MREVRCPHCNTMWVYNTELQFRAGSFTFTCFKDGEGCGQRFRINKDWQTVRIYTQKLERMFPDGHLTVKGTVRGPKINVQPRP